MSKQVQYKLLSIDLDGTLLTKFKRITKKDLISLYNYGSQGGLILINTGKSLQSSYKYIQQVKAATGNIKYCSCLNGNLIYDIDKHEIIHYNSIKSEDCKKIYDIVRQHKNKYMCYPIAPGDHKHPKIKNQSNLGILMTRINEIMKYNRTKNPFIEESYKINILTVAKKIDHDIIKEIEALGTVDVLTTNERLFEIVKKGSNKGTSLKKIMQIYNLKKEDVAAIGDSHNDLAMFYEAGTAFLVKDKRAEDLRNAADFIITKKKNKVSEVINNYILKQW